LAEISGSITEDMIIGINSGDGEKDLITFGEDNDGGN